ncbi:MAG: hypothetical protein IJ708_16470 [Clostridia bacterium]|nr:hypothetical protein [Clostridia bacterium]
MDDRELALKLIGDFVPEAWDNEAFTQYLKAHLDTYYDYGEIERIRNSLRWKMQECVHNAREDYDFLRDTVHPVEVDVEKREIRFGAYVLPAYWCREGISPDEMEDIKLRYKRMWENQDYGEIRFPMLQNWHPLDAWRKRYSDALLQRMEEDLEAGTGDEAMKLYALYARRACIHELDWKYPDKIKAILSVDHRNDTETERTAELTLLLYDGSTCRVRVGTDRRGRYCSTTALTRPGFPMFTEADDKMIQETVFDQVPNGSQYEA